MNEHHWTKYGVLAIGGLGLVLLLVLIFSYGLNSEGDLEDRTWVVQEMNIGATMTAPAEGVVSYAVFSEGTVAGSAGCNNYNGSYETDGGSITIGPIAATLMFCEGAMDQEIAYLGALGAVDSYEVSGDELTLSNGDTVLIKYKEGTIDAG
jgi:heat shock protein HslJ